MHQAFVNQIVINIYLYIDIDIYIYSYMYAAEFYINADAFQQ